MRQNTTSKVINHSGCLKFPFLLWNRQFPCDFYSAICWFLSWARRNEYAAFLSQYYYQFNTVSSILLGLTNLVLICVMQKFNWMNGSVKIKFFSSYLPMRRLHASSFGTPCLAVSLPAYLAWRGVGNWRVLRDVSYNTHTANCKQNFRTLLTEREKTYSNLPVSIVLSGTRQ